MIVFCFQGWSLAGGRVEVTPLSLPSTMEAANSGDRCLALLFQVFSSAMEAVHHCEVEEWRQMFAPL